MARSSSWVASRTRTTARPTLRTQRAILLACVAALAGQLGCSAIGDPGGVPDGLPHGGTGQFRFLDSEETAVRGSLPGYAMVLRNREQGAVSVTETHIFYAQGDLVDEPPMVPEDFPPNEVFDGVYGPLRIHRGVARQEGVGAYDAGGQVLAPSEAWEGEEVFDPWIVEHDGGARLYYAAAGGIGVAEASAIDGSFTKRPGPIVDAAADGASARRPSVVELPDGSWLMVYDRGDGLATARSDDGVTFTVEGPLALPGEDEGDSPEVRIASPGVLRLVTTSERPVYRLYFESIREDGEHHVYLAGSFDGETWERWPRPVIDNTDVRFPAPLALDSRITLLYLNLPFSNVGFQSRGLSVTVAPAGQRFDPPAAE